MPILSSRRSWLGMGMKAWDSVAAEILSMIDSQTEAMSQYIPLVQ